MITYKTGINIYITYKHFPKLNVGLEDQISPLKDLIYINILL
jgi:hypothetical protein